MPPKCVFCWGPEKDCIIYPVLAASRSKRGPSTTAHLDLRSESIAHFVLELAARERPSEIHKRKATSYGEIRLLHLLSLLLRGFLHGFRLFLVGLVQHLLLLLDRLLGLARVFLGTDALRLSRYRRQHSSNEQQHKSSNSFHSVSERRSCSDLTPKLRPSWDTRRYFCNPTCWWRVSVPPAGLHALGSLSWARRALTRLHRITQRAVRSSESSSSSATCNPSADTARAYTAS